MTSPLFARKYFAFAQRILLERIEDLEIRLLRALGNPAPSRSMTSSPAAENIGRNSYSLPRLRVASRYGLGHRAQRLLLRAKQRRDAAIREAEQPSSAARSKVPCSPVPCTSTYFPADVITMFMSTSARTSSG